ncbi:MAG: DMT family transporter [Desulfobacteraceae bacterium]|nr:DMT family transporter [Desulfobacteraceae bacterium]
MALNNQKSIKMEKSLAGPLFMLSAAVLFTIMTLLVKSMPGEYTVWHLGFIRFSGGLTVLLLVFGRKKNLYKGHNIPLLITRGCTGSLAFLFVVTALRILPISTAMVIFYSFPVFAALFAFIIYKESITIFQFGCMVMVFCGVAILFDFSLTGSIFGQTMAVVSGAFAGLTITLITNLRQHNGPATIYLYLCTMGSIATIPVFIMNPILPATPVEWFMIAGIILTSCAAQLLMNQGFYYCKGWEGGVYMSSETIFTLIAGIVLLNDPVSWRLWIGSSLILCSGFLLNWYKNR